MDRTNMPDAYLLDDKTWAAIETLLSTVYAGARRHDDRRIVSGIVHVLRSGCRWKDCPAVYGPCTTVYNRFNRWSGRGLWQGMLDVLAGTVADDTRSIDSTSIKVQRSAAGGEGGASEQAIGRSRGGRTTKIHGVADSQGRLFRFTLTAGNIADITAAHGLAAKLPSNGCLIGDMGYDATNRARTWRSAARRRSFRPIPPTSTSGTSTKRPTKTAILSSRCGVGSKTSAESQPAMTSWLAISPPP
jgi:transposase